VHRCSPRHLRSSVDLGLRIRERHALAELGSRAVRCLHRGLRGERRSFGPSSDPAGFDPRLITTIAPAVAKAAMDKRRGHAADRRP